MIICACESMKQRSGVANKRPASASSVAERTKHRLPSGCKYLPPLQRLLQSPPNSSPVKLRFADSHRLGFGGKQFNTIVSRIHCARNPTPSVLVAPDGARDKSNTAIPRMANGFTPGPGAGESFNCQITQRRNGGALYNFIKTHPMPLPNAKRPYMTTACCGRAIKRQGKARRAQGGKRLATA